MIHRKTTLLITLLLFLFSPKLNFGLPPADNDGSLKTIVIDAGHGGNDAGCLGSNSKEKYMAFDIAMKLGEMIKAQMPGVKVIYTRPTDDNVPLYERVAKANSEKADLFISIHANMDADNTAAGTETYILGTEKNTGNFEMAIRENKVIVEETKVRENYNDFDPESREFVSTISVQKDSALYEASKIFANDVEDQFSNTAKRNSRGVKQTGLLILNNLNMPAVMIEVGFLSNYEEEKDLKTSGVKDQLATAIYQAIKKYKVDSENKRRRDIDNRKTMEAEAKRKAAEDDKRIRDNELANANAQRVSDSIATANAQAEEMAKTANKQVTKSPKSGNNRKEANGRLNTPCYIIGCTAVPSKTEAEGVVTELQNNGLTAGYMWIPDYEPTGKSLYRVYVGPFSSDGEANSALKGVKQYYSVAYVRHVD